MASVVEELQSVADLCGRIRFSWRGAELMDDLLAPVAALLGAETASFRALSLGRGTALLESVVSLGVPSSVDDAYLNHYFMLDPARRLLQRRLAQPLFAHPTRPGEWATEQGSAAERWRFRAEFLRYRAEFLLPNDFFHHVGFCVQDSAGRLLLFDFHRPARAPAFTELELAKAQVVAICLHAKAARSAPLQNLPQAAGADRPLSVRELAVAEAIASGLSNKEVATRLDISVRTVENHLRSIFAKLSVTTRARLAAKLRATETAGGSSGTARH